jgi:hypothetical protein
MLFDSEYKLPNENFRVINDEDPIKKAALEEARLRYERLVEKEKKRNELLIKIEQESIKRGLEENI